MLLIEEETLKIKKAKSIMADTFPWQHVHLFESLPNCVLFFKLELYEKQHN